MCSSWDELVILVPVDGRLWIAESVTGQCHIFASHCVDYDMAAVVDASEFRRHSDNQMHELLEAIVQAAAVVALVGCLDAIDDQDPFVWRRVLDWDSLVVPDSNVVVGQRDAFEVPEDLEIRRRQINSNLVQYN